jgi:hypothetical protein
MVFFSEGVMAMPDSGYKYINAAEERHAERVRNGRAINGPAGMIVKLIGKFIQYVFYEMTYLSRKRSGDMIRSAP